MRGTNGSKLAASRRKRYPRLSYICGKRLHTHLQHDERALKKLHALGRKYICVHCGNWTMPWIVREELWFERTGTPLA